MSEPRSASPFGTIRRWLAPPIFEGDEDKTRQARLLNTVLWAFLVALVGYGTSAVLLPNAYVAWIVVAVLLVVESISLAILRRGEVRRASFLFALGVWALLTTVGVFFGSTSPALFGYMIVVLIAGLLMGGPAALHMSALALGATILLAVLDVAGVLPPPAGPNSPIANALVAALYLVLAAVLLRSTIGSLNEALRRSRGLAAQLQIERGRLEEAVQTRTQDLSRRTRYLETTAAIARDAAQVLDLQQLLSGVAQLISDRFDFYHCGVFLLDQTGEWAVLQAASSEGGQRMLQRQHRLRVGKEAEGIVGYACTHAEARVALDVGADAVFFKNPDLPATRSEMVLPLRARGELIGALDVQSDRPRAFSDEDVGVLQTLAEQVAVAISNARLFRQVGESLEAERRAYAEISQQGWAEMLRARAGLGFRYDKGGVARIQDGDEYAPSGEHAPSGEYAPSREYAPSATTDGGDAGLSLPILHRGQAVGSIEAHKDRGEWTPTEAALMHALADQLSVALESARLFQDARRHAAHEQAVRHITEQMRRAMEMEAILQTTVAEVGRALGVPRAYVRLGAGPATTGRPAAGTPPSDRGRDPAPPGDDSRQAAGDAGDGRHE